MIDINHDLTLNQLADHLLRFWPVSRQKNQLLLADWSPGTGAPVFTVNGIYTSRNWTDWTQGFQIGSHILQYEGDGNLDELYIGRERTISEMHNYITHMGVHDHGFNILSTYGNLLRLAIEGSSESNPWEQSTYKLALQASGAVQASRWTSIPGGGFVHSFNGPHSLFADTIRSMRSLATAHLLGQYLRSEQDEQISLLARMIDHSRTTAKYIVYYGENRDIYDISGRVAHEAIFNTTNGSYRCPSTQQGYSPFTTWTRGLAWTILGFAELLEFFHDLPTDLWPTQYDQANVLAEFTRTASVTANYYLEIAGSDGIPLWDSGAPGNSGEEPVDSSAAAIAAQGLLRLGRLWNNQQVFHPMTLWSAGLTIAKALFEEPYLSLDPAHQGLLLHSIYHRPNGWDHIQHGDLKPSGEACMWGDYHLRELAVYLQRLIDGRRYHSFYAGLVEF